MTKYRSTKSPVEPRIGIGCLVAGGDEEPVAYEFRLTRHPRGGDLLVGTLTGDPDFIRAAFRQGQVRLKLDDGLRHDVTIVAHTSGAPTAFFEGGVEQTGGWKAHGSGKANRGEF